MKLKLVIVLFSLFLLTGCPNPNTAGQPPAPPVPPQVTVANGVLALAHAVDGVTDSAIACRQQSKCSPEDVTAIENVVKEIATVGKKIDAELRSPDTWDTQKVKIVQFVSSSGLKELKTHVSPSGQILIVSIVTVFDQISAAVGGPQL